MSHEMEMVTKGVEQSSAVKQTETLPVPCPKFPITVRPGMLDDLPFIDSLQKKTTKQVGFMPTKQFEGKIKLGHVLVAEEGIGNREEGIGEESASDSALCPMPSALSPRPVGYLIGNDQYFKRDDVGIIYQINVVESHRRGLIAASLLKAQFDRSAYGCKLYCCWCAQDLDANYFWESMGFVPLAFRAGSAAKARVHIFWQKRIRAGDETTPWWFPSQTTGGSIREDRLVLPIPPGTRWSDEMPRILPQEELPVASGQLPVKERKRSERSSPPTDHRTPATQYAISRSKLHFVAPKPAKALKEKAPKERRKKTKNDPRLVTAARELRDRWLEKVNADPSLLESREKYQVARAIEEASVVMNDRAALPRLPDQAIAA